MLNSGKKNNILSLVLSGKKNSERKKNHSLQVKWAVPYHCGIFKLFLLVSESRWLIILIRIVLQLNK